MTHKKFGLRYVRPPLEVLDELRTDHFNTGKGGPMFYRVDRRTSHGPLRYVVYRCNRIGNRLRGAVKHFFDPIRYPRKPRPAPTPGAETSAVQAGGTEAELEEAAQNVPVPPDLEPDADEDTSATP